jgi:DNA replication and repair protein RecF
MRFSATYFHNFRNIQHERREWPQGFNLITGPNGAGKTNFLEGLNLISGWGPLERNTRIASLVRWKDDGREERASLWGRVSGEEDADIFASLSVRCSLKIGEGGTDATTMRGRIPVLSWLSGHASILRGGASNRRALLDRVGALVSPSYAARLHDYRYALRQKTALLRKSYNPAIADRVMIPLGSWLWAAREEITRMIGNALREFADLTPRPVDLSFARGGGGLEDNPATDFRRGLVLNRDRERASRIPLVGPQRDDVRISCGSRDAAVALSRGQSRRTASALILASALVVERRLGRKPILVFDELASELDSEGRSSTIDALMRTGCQIFAASTDPIPAAGVELHRMISGKFL